MNCSTLVELNYPRKTHVVQWEWPSGITIAAILAQPQMRARWKERFGELPTESVVNELYREFLPRQRELISEHAEYVAGRD